MFLPCCWLCFFQIGESRRSDFVVEFYPVQRIESCYGNQHRPSETPAKSGSARVPTVPLTRFLLKSNFCRIFLFFRARMPSETAGRGGAGACLKGGRYRRRKVRRPVHEQGVELPLQLRQDALAPGKHRSVHALRLRARTRYPLRLGLSC